MISIENKIDHSNRLRQDYEEQGFAVADGVLDADLVAEARDHVEWLLERNPDLPAEALSHHLMTQDAFWVRLVSDDRLLDIAAQFIGNDIGLFASHYIAKPPRTGKAVPWHQDGSYWPLKPMQVVTLWLSLDVSNEENGCLQVIPGTHLENLINKADYIEQAENQAFEIALDPSLVDESKAHSLILNEGSVSIHHPNITHGSKANNSDRWRRGLTIRYIPTSTQITLAQPHPGAFIFRGDAKANGNGWNPLPEFDPDHSMSFIGCDSWDKKCRRLNEKYGSLYV